MNAQQFRSRVASLHNIDLAELIEAGVIPADDGRVNSAAQREWVKLNANPFAFLLKLDDERLEKLWELIEARHVGR